MKKEGQKSSGWKYVMLGQIPGVLLGSAAMMMGKQRYEKGIDLEGENFGEDLADGEGLGVVPVAAVDSSLSYEDAFFAAREQVGPGGVFEWQGNIYNTYSKAEWEAMSEEQKEEFIEDYMNTDLRALGGIDDEEVVDADEDEESVDLDDGFTESDDDPVAEVEDAEPVAEQNAEPVIESEEFIVDMSEAESVVVYESSGSLDVAHVSDDMSFSQAFAAARAEVGAGGVFSWRGQVYNTFYKEEWDSMSAADKAEFARDVQATDVDTYDYYGDEPEPITPEPIGILENLGNESPEVRSIEGESFQNEPQMSVNLEEAFSGDLPDYINDADTSAFE